MKKITIDQLKDLADRSLGAYVPVPEEFKDATAQYYPFLYMLGEMLEPDIVVELGTGGMGRSTVHLALGSPGAKIIGVDLAPPKLLQYPNVKIIEGDTRLVSQEIEDKFSPIDILFIDSTHESEHASCEFNLYWPLLRVGGVVLADDINMSGMQGFWEQVPEPKFYHSELHSHCGFGVAIKEKNE